MHVSVGSFLPVATARLDLKEETLSSCGCGWGLFGLLPSTVDQVPFSVVLNPARDDVLGEGLLRLQTTEVCLNLLVSHWVPAKEPMEHSTNIVGVGDLPAPGLLPVLVADFSIDVGGVRSNVVDEPVLELGAEKDIQETVLDSELPFRTDELDSEAMRGPNKSVLSN